MKFDYTKGKTANYGVRVYGWNVNDIYYVYYYGEAKTLFEQLKRKKLDEGTIVSIYDMKKDMRKAFYKA